MAKTLSWTDDGLASEDGRFVVGVIHGLDGQPLEYYWERCPLLKPGKPTEDSETYDGQTVLRHEDVVADERPHPCASLEEMHEQAAAMNRSRSALGKFEAPRLALRRAETAQRRQASADEQLDALVDRVLARLRERGR